MSNGAYVARRVAEELRRHGEAMTLKRTGQADLPVYGKRFGASRDEITADVVITEVNVIISNAEIAGSLLTTPPKKGDKLVVGGKERALTQDADTRVEGGVTIEHRLLVK